MSKNHNKDDSGNTLVTVTNLKRDTIKFPPVYRAHVDGKPTGTGYTLHLGSQDDAPANGGDAKLLQPSQPVPMWAVEKLREDPSEDQLSHFRHLESNHAITVSTPA